MLKRWMAFSLFIALSGQHYLCAQDPLILEPPLPDIPLEETVDEAVEEATEGEPAAEFELPEIDVIGRLNSFPANPIPDGASITATRTTLLLAETGSSITVVTSEQLQAMQQPILSDALRQIQGVDVNRTGGPGGLTSIFLRGANSQHTKVMLDGIPINDPSNAGRSFDFSSMSTANIERVEILRGPQSVLYGTDAIGGVINIITKRGEGPATIRAAVEGGSMNTSNSSINLSGGDDLFYYSASASYLGTDGVSRAEVENGNPERDAYYNGTVSGRFGFTPSDLFNVDYVFRYTDAHTAVDDFPFGGSPIDNLMRSNLSDVFYQRVQFQSFQMDGMVEHKVALNSTNYDRTDTDSGYLDPRYEGQTQQVDYQMNALLLDNNVLTVGADHLQEDASSSSVAKTGQYYDSIYFQDQYAFGERVHGTAGYRWVDHSAAGTAQTYRFTLLVKTPEIGADFHGSLATGFRAPSLAENLFPFGNPNLRPEHSKGWDIGVTKSFLADRWIVDATYFRNDFTDLINYDFGAMMLENIGRARSSGVELVSDWYIGPTTDVRATYTYTDTLNSDTGDQLQRRPRNKASLGIEQTVDDGFGHINMYLLYVGNRFDTTGPLADYITVNVAGSYDLRPGVQLTARIDNLFDEQYQEVPDFGTVGLAAYGGLRFVW
ncbi:MAG: hypothetical protein COA78_26030 [Blastopirellula sp.]|nr:MAG: hypothetical protein COA78_26030 [Blastopirellula sp.]